ncbi:unnamed protein product [Effrenium voratum]|nr:unnamed protein product [Effrenium voratum]
MWCTTVSQAQSSSSMDAATKASFRKMQALNAQDLANSLWPMAAPKAKEKDFTEEVAAAAMKNLRCLSPQGLSNLSQAPAALVFLGLPPASAAATVCAGAASASNSQEPANAARALATTKAAGTTAFAEV